MIFLFLLCVVAPPAGATGALPAAADTTGVISIAPADTAEEVTASPAVDDTTGAIILSLDQALQLALTESYDARTLKLNLLEAQQDVEAARRRFRTQADLDLNLPNFSENVRGVQPAPGELPQYGTYGSLLWQSELALRQPLPTNGSLGFSATLYQRGDSYYDPLLDRRDKDKTFFNSYRIDFKQPLFVPNSLKLGLEKARLDLDQSERAYTRVQLDIIYRVTNQFYSYLRAQRSEAIARDALRQQTESYQLAKQKFEAGLIPEVEALQMEVDLAQSRNDLLSARGRLARAADQFRMQVGLPMDSKVVVSASTEVHFYEVDESMARQHALEHRSEIQDAAANLRRAQITVQETDARSTVRGELNAYYDLVGISDPSLSYESSLGDYINSSWNDLGRRPGNRGVSFSLSVPLWDSGVNHAEVGAARAVLQRRDLDREQNRRKVIQEVNAALTALQEARERLQALSRSRDLAGRSYRISQERFANGDITSQDLALDRDRWTQARLAWLDAFIQYQLAGADLKRQTLYDFEHGRSLVDSGR